MAFTVAPLHNLALPAGTRIPFAKDLVFQDIPDWVRKESFLNRYLSYHDRQGVLNAKHAFVAEYEATSIGEPDPAWKGEEPRSIQASKSEAVLLANLALWLRQPSSVCFTVVLHGLSWTFHDLDEKQQVIQQSEGQHPLYCHPNDLHNPVSPAHLVMAAELHTVLCSIPRGNAVWVALRALWAGLTTYPAEIRYSLLWIGLEAVFGADDNTGEIGYKLAQGIAFFLAETQSDARELFRTVKQCYGIRSKIVHGRWKKEAEIDVLMLHTESISRTVFRRLLQSPHLLETFVSKHRDKFLEDWVFSRSLDPPPFPPT